MGTFIGKTPGEPTGPIEQLVGAGAAQVLGITREAGAKGYVRTLKRLKGVLAAVPGGWEGF